MTNSRHYNEGKKRLKVSRQNFSFMIRSVVEKKASVKLKAKGRSMFPNIIDGDILTIAPYIDTNPEVGDVVALYLLDRNQVIIHRIIKKTNGFFFIKGDGLLRSDGLFPRENIVGLICNVERNNIQLPIDQLKNKMNIILSKLRIFSLIRLLLPGSFFRSDKKKY